MKKWWDGGLLTRVCPNRDYFFDVGSEQEMVDWVQSIENVLGVGQNSVNLQDFELLTMVPLRCCL